MNDSTDIDLNDEQVTQEPKESVSGRVAAVIVLLILLLLGCGLLWPVPDSERITDLEPRDRAFGRAGALELERVDLSVDEDIPAGHKGVAVVVSMSLRSDETRVFDPGWAKLDISGTMIPPLSQTHEGVSRRSSFPATLEADRAASVSLVFAVPKGSRDTTLVIQPGDLPPTEAVVRRLGLPGGL